MRHLWNQVRMWVLVIFQSKAALLGVCLWGGSISDSNAAEMLHPGVMHWRTTLRMSPLFIE